MYLGSISRQGKHEDKKIKLIFIINILNLHIDKLLVPFLHLGKSYWQYFSYVHSCFVCTFNSLLCGLLLNCIYSSKTLRSLIQIGKKTAGILGWNLTLFLQKKNTCAVHNCQGCIIIIKHKSYLPIIYHLLYSLELALFQRLHIIGYRYSLNPSLYRSLLAFSC